MKSVRMLVITLVALAAGVLPPPGPALSADGNTITTLDWGTAVGKDTSVVLDGSGYPVVSYYDSTNRDLKVMHCNDVDCAGGNESITSPDTDGDVGMYTSLALDGDGLPVVSYFDATYWDLKVLHCGNANCTAGNSITSPDSTGSVGSYTSLALDSEGFPVVSYHDSTNRHLKVMHCNDADCADDDESITSPDTSSWVGQYTSLVLDSYGHPVVSYHDYALGYLKVMLCDDDNCAGNDEWITSPDTAGVGWHTSLALDSYGYPVVSYLDLTGSALKVLHCGDAMCGSGNTINSPDTEGDVGMYTSLALDSAGHPVVSYFDLTKGDLKVLRCWPADCSYHYWTTITSPDTAGGVGMYTSLVLDSDGFPVVSYYDATYGELKVLHCGYYDCASGNSTTAPDPGGDVGWWTSLALDGSGRPVVSYYDYDNRDLKVRRCSDANCTSAGGASPDTGAWVGEYTSLALDGSGFPVISYFDRGNWDLKVLRCGNADCTSPANSIESPDTTGTVGFYTSLVLDSSGHPVVSYFDIPNGNLKVMHCNDDVCDGGDESIISPDGPGIVGEYTSLALDGSGRPVVSYYDWTNKNLKVLRCNDVNCTSGMVASPDQGGDVGMFTSLVLDGSWYPVVSYFDNTNGNLKVMHCNDVACAGLNESITSPDTDGIVGEFSSLALDSDGYPVVSYYDRTNGDLKVMHCNDLNCAGGNETITSPDTTGIVGAYTSLALDSDGYPVVSYYDASHWALKLLDCGSANCTTGGAGGVGGIQALPDVAGGGSSAPNVLAIGSAVAGGALLLAAGVWGMRRRRAG